MRSRPSHFWNASTAFCVAGPTFPSASPLEQVAEAGQLVLRGLQAAHRRRPGATAAGGFGGGDVRGLEVLQGERLRGRDPGEHAERVPPSSSSLTFVAPSTPTTRTHELRQPRRRLAGSFPSPKVSRMSTVARPFDDSDAFSEAVPAGT